MKQIGDLWEQVTKNFKSWEEAKGCYKLWPNERPSYMKIIALIPLDWRHMITTAKYITKGKEFLGLFHHPNDPIPFLVVQNSSEVQL